CCPYVLFQRRWLANLQEHGRRSRIVQPQFLYTTMLPLPSLTLLVSGCRDAHGADGVTLGEVTIDGGNHLDMLPHLCRDLPSNFGRDPCSEHAIRNRHSRWH